MKVHSLLDEGLILARLNAQNREGVLHEMVARLEAGTPTIARENILDKLLKREELGTTAIGHGVAIPHCRANGLKAPILLLGLSKEGVPFASVDGKLSHVFFLLVSPQDNPNAGLRNLAAIAALTRQSRSLAAKLLRASEPAQILQALREEEEKTRA
jgi:mannitol/fructose-specific phosphotransferase system IIA component (Ntr-type)